MNKSTKEKFAGVATIRFELNNSSDGWSPVYPGTKRPRRHRSELKASKIHWGLEDSDKVIWLPIVYKLSVACEAGDHGLWLPSYIPLIEGEFTGDFPLSWNEDLSDGRYRVRMVFRFPEELGIHSSKIREYWERGRRHKLDGFDKENY